MTYNKFYNIQNHLYQFVLLLVFIFLELSLLSYNPADPSSSVVFPNNEHVANYCGGYGAWWAHEILANLGYGAYFMLFALGIHFLRTIFCRPSQSYVIRFVGFCCLQIAICAFLTLFFCNNLPNRNPIYGDDGFSYTFSTNLIYGHGGIVGASWGAFFAKPGVVVAYVFVLVTGFMGLSLYSEFFVPYVVREGLRNLIKRKHRKTLAWFRWYFGARSGWEYSWKTPSQIRRMRLYLRKRKNEENETGNVANGLNDDLLNVKEENNLLILKDQEEHFTENRDNSQKNDSGYPQEEAVDGYEIDGENPARHNLRKGNNSERSTNNSAKGEKESGENRKTGDVTGAERGVAVYQPESTPMAIVSGGLERLQPNTGVALEATTDSLALQEMKPDKIPYVFPSIELLDKPEEVDYSEFSANAEASALGLEKIFNEFGIVVKVKNIQLGPTITQYQVQPERGLKVARVASCASDLAVKLGVSNVRIVYPLLGKQNLIGIEIPNEQKQLVRLREVMMQLAGTYEHQRIPMFLGKDVAGKPLVADLTTMPHLLIAGSTGTGKSVCLNSIIASIIMTRDPDDVRMLMIDPKMVEMSQYTAIPHLMNPVVTDMKKAEEILAWAVDKMEERYVWLARARVRSITDYNKLSFAMKMERVKPTEMEKMPKKMPFIVIVVDEMADMMMTAPKEVESHIIRLAQKSRAVGIHLILATQKPIVSVITSLIKSNLPARIAFKVASKTDSRVVLDTNGADQLLGHGDMLFLLPGTSSLIRAQGTYLSDEEIYRIVESISTEEPQFDGEITQHLAGAGGGKIEEWATKDELYISAIEIIVNERRGSITLLQRMLGIGYGRAARLIDFMQEDKIVGEFKGYTRPRDVLLSKEEWQEMKADLERAQETLIRKEAERGRAERLMAQNLEEYEADEVEDAIEDEVNKVHDDTDLDDINDDINDNDNDDDDWEKQEHDGIPDDDEFENDFDESDESFNEDIWNDKGGDAGIDDLDAIIPWNTEDADSDTDTDTDMNMNTDTTTSGVPYYPPRRTFERSNGRSRRRRTPNYDKIRTHDPISNQDTSTDTVNTPESQDVLRRIQPNQPKPFMNDDNDNYQEIR